ncbi:siderophore ferric iron reductase [Vibrio sp. FNV 38]|nr:siderophore ferric iron reductase [Vibrio sp. FNV 38]
MSNHFHSSLFTYSMQISPYLAGEVINPLTYSIRNDAQCAEAIHTLYERIALNHPEGGAAYWMTRTWESLIWQPIYISFMSVYAFQTLPDIKSMAQQIQGSFVAGYQFPDTTHQHGSVQELVSKACAQLRELFDHYLQAMNQNIRIRPGYASHLTADLVMNSIAKMQAMQPEFSHSNLLDEAQLWTKALTLPKKHIEGFTAQPDGSGTKYTRTSCCLFYRCESGSLCVDCPRQN